MGEDDTGEGGPPHMDIIVAGPAAQELADCLRGTVRYCPDLTSLAAAMAEGRTYDLALLDPALTGAPRLLADRCEVIRWVSAAPPRRRPSATSSCSGATSRSTSTAAGRRSCSPI